MEGTGLRDEQRTALAIFLSLIVILIYTNFFVPRPPVPTAQPVMVSETQQAALKQEILRVPTTTAATATSVESSGVVALAARADSGVVTVDTDTFTAELYLLGGGLKSYVLKNYFENISKGKNLNLVANKDGVLIPLSYSWGNSSDDNVLYALDKVSGGASINDNQVVFSGNGDLTLVGTHPELGLVTKRLSFSSTGYTFSSSFTAATQPQGLQLNFSTTDIPTGGAAYTGAFTYLAAGKLHHAKGDSPTPVTGVSWVGITSHGYFASFLIGPDGGSGAILKKEPLGLVAAIAAMPGTATKLFVGPKEESSLRLAGHELYRSFDLGVFSILAHPLLSLLRLFNSIFNNYGLAIILLVLIIKLLFLPLTKKTFKSMRAMQEIQPEMNALKERVKDPAQLRQEIFALYQKKGINPFGGCLPTLVQIPVFIGLYNVLLYSIELRHAPFALWITDLSAPERLSVFGFGVPVMVLIMGVLMFVQQWTAPSMGDPAQRKAMMIMPIIFTFLFIGFPAGLTLYWLVNNIMSLVQQLYIQGTKVGSPVQATVVSGAALFGFAYVLTVI